MHALLLQLSFGGQGLGRPAFGFPWGVPAIGMPELRLVFAPTHVAPSGRPAAGMSRTT